ncbi:GNAT family N-acetyltransferase [Secundilactobacillus collinoides]|uniref:N-acetyltransferase domain-containing protein n=1 Tax=Secundilactobacillus collinoides DSM 20515 = JCM 1123 TaxID=1423733 RepID=A0A0R2B812_SECCO|nr:GNAT family N-acetyltransferase [Secundilactobacillus collinoides]KRM75303.1 hypothetical protein FC82_GL002492 [Secundilactobacillus collinoides DSM 20515 = JCM 1123]
MQIKNLDAINDTQLAQLMSIWLSSNLAGHDFIQPEYWRHQRDNVARQMRESDVTAVVDDDGEILGFAVTLGNTLLGIYTRTNAQKQGVGSMLLFALKAKKPHLKLSVFQKNEDAVLFFERHGFKTTKTYNESAVGESRCDMRL